LKLRSSVSVFIFRLDAVFMCQLLSTRFCLRESDGGAFRGNERAQAQCLKTLRRGETDVAAGDPKARLGRRLRNETDDPETTLPNPANEKIGTV
jgi:hypothetical protein